MEELQIDLRCKTLLAVTGRTGHTGQTGNFRRKPVSLLHKAHQPAKMHTRKAH